jgi:SAM-dependent methyltransferase
MGIIFSWEQGLGEGGWMSLQGLRIPWYAKLGAKLCLARIPLRHDWWRRLGVFRDGFMQDPAYALRIFDLHARWMPRSRDHPDLLELGPGDSISSGLIAYARGSGATTLVDSTDHAVRDLRLYGLLIDELARRYRNVGPLRAAESFDELLQASRTRYLTAGVDSLARIRSSSVDFVFSNAVLEHVRHRDVDAVLAETRRILRPGGVASHVVDLRDHLADALNNLRFSPRLWESGFMADSGFYTNRIRFAEMLRRFEAAGFRTRIVELVTWSRLPTPRSRLASEFRRLEEADLRVQSFHALLT